MAKAFDPSKLSASDQAAFANWQQQLRQYVAQSGGGVPAPVTYALAHPEYLQSHPELRQGYEIVTGAALPQSTRDALKGFHPVWDKGQAGMQKDSGLFNKWETWLQLGLGSALGGVAAAGALGGAGAAGGGAAAGSATGAGAVPALGGGATLAANLGGAGALGAGGAGLAAPAAAAGGSFWKDLLGVGSAGDVLRTGANLAGNYLQSRQIDKATQAQVDAANKALELQRRIYEQQRSDLSPYRNIGSSSVSELSRLMGLPAASDTTTPFFQPQGGSGAPAAPLVTGPTGAPAPHQTNPNNAPVVGQAVPRTLSGLAGDGMVNMVSPDGRPARVPQNQVQAALAAGGRMA